MGRNEKDGERKRGACASKQEQVERPGEKEIITVKADGERKLLKFETTEKVWKELTARGKSGVNLSVNRSKEEGKGRGLRYLSEGKTVGV